LSHGFDSKSGKIVVLSSEQLVAVVNKYLNAHPSYDFLVPRKPKKELTMGKLSLSRMACIVSVFSAVAVAASPAITTFKALVKFDWNNGDAPYGGLVPGIDGNFYGTTAYGGADCSGGYDCGTVFRITPKGELAKLHSFCSQANCADGAQPDGGLVQAIDGNFYGTTRLGGANGYGTVFKITSNGQLTTLHSFNPTNNGFYPYAALIQGTDGNFYGTTAGQQGQNPNCSNDACGTVFKITPSGKLTTLHSFNFTDGAFPTAALVQGTDSNFYGTTAKGGGNGNPYCCGTVFEITPAGKLTTLHSFCSEANCTDGLNPYAAFNGNFYGTTVGGGLYDWGTVFRITPLGKLTTLYSFCSQTNCTDGKGPAAGLVQATDGNFYGTTFEGSANYDGTVFKITPSGKLTTLHTFDSTNGATPFAALVQGTDGNFYGTTTAGGNKVSHCYNGACGTVFSLSVGLGRFVETQPTSGKVGATILILGNNLRSATSVSFNVTAATFEVVSSTEIKTGVPTGATTGFVTVTTAKRTLKSNVVFRVTK
jgi:uncharacterized repeat protein (TIGR03803 family)